MTDETPIITYQEKEVKRFDSIRVEEFASGFEFTEGPAWHGDGYLLFSDTPANKIWQIFADGRKQVWLDPAGLLHDDVSNLSDMVGSNGLAFDQGGRLLICQHGEHAISRLEKNGKLTVLCNEYEGRSLNSPNDLVVHSNGAIYFTDPPYGLKDQILNPSRHQRFAGIYRYSNDQLLLLNDDLRYPNGICLSPDEKFLYVSSNHPEEPLILKFSLSPAGDMGTESILIEQNADGITTDKRGNLLLCTDKGVLVVSPSGLRIALISLPQSPTNIVWHSNKTELYITARKSIYKISGYKN
jgi:gluconolactonase